jgi:hypothetical protein
MEFLSELTTFISLTGDVSSVVRLDDTFMCRGLHRLLHGYGCPGGDISSLIHVRTWKSLYSR